MLFRISSLRIFLVLFSLGLAPGFLFGQYGETIRTGRPGQAIGAFALGKNVFQIQSGYNYNAFDIDQMQAYIRSNNTVLRLGLTERIEMSGVVNYNSESNTRGGGTIKGIANYHLGGRINLSENRGLLPTIGVQGKLIYNPKNEFNHRGSIGSKVIVATGNAISKKLSLGTNFGFTWTETSSDILPFYVVNTSLSISNSVSVFAEVYGNSNENWNFDTGMAMLINKDLQLDASLGWQGLNGERNWFFDIGFSWRIDWRP